jgi:hypothetical protein
MSLAPYELEAAKADSIHVTSNIVVVRQSNRRLLLRGEESGGAGPKVGHYVGFAALEGHPFSVVHEIKWAPNAQHRMIFGSVLLRFEVFRHAEKQVHTQISLHTVSQPTDSRANVRNIHLRRLLFEGRFGDLSEDDSPQFISSAGEPVSIPVFLLPGFKLALKGSREHSCNYACFRKAAPIVLPPYVLNALHLPDPIPAQVEA